MNCLLGDDSLGYQCLGKSSAKAFLSKLTLSVRDRVVSRAKRYAKQRGVSVSKIVEAYLASVV